MRARGLGEWQRLPASRVRPVHDSPDSRVAARACPRSRACRELANQIAAGEVVERPGLGRQGAGRERARCRRHARGDHVEFGGKKLDRRRGRRRGHVARGREPGASSGTPPARSGRAADLAGHPHARVPGRGAALDRVGVALPAPDARARRALSGTEIRVDGGLHRVASARSARRRARWSRSAISSSTCPARRKFLKADTAEAAQVSRLVTQLALGIPSVGFTLTSGGRALLEAPPARSLEDRFFQLYGDRADLVAVGKQAAGMAVTGFVAALGEQGPARGPQHVFVNRRIVRDRTIAHAIQQAYSVATIKERSPEVHLFIELPRRSRGRQRAPDESRSPFPRSESRARDSAPRHRRRARRGRRAGARALGRDAGACGP